MRKRVLISLVATIGVGILVYVLSQPKEGTVEWHKREYRAALSRLYHQRLADKAQQFFHRIAGKKPPQWRWNTEDADRLDSERAALLKLGYLSQQDFALTNASFLQVIDSPEFASAQKRCHSGYSTITWVDTNMLRVFAAPEDLPLFATAFHKVDVENGK